MQERSIGLGNARLVAAKFVVHPVNAISVEGRLAARAVYKARADKKLPSNNPYKFY